MFSHQEQEEIINQFLDVIKVQDYITNSKLQRKNVGVTTIKSMTNIVC